MRPWSDGAGRSGQRRCLAVAARGASMVVPFVLGGSDERGVSELWGGWPRRRCAGCAVRVSRWFSRAAARSCWALSGSRHATSAPPARRCWRVGSRRSPRWRCAMSRSSRRRSRAGQLASHRLARRWWWIERSISRCARALSPATLAASRCFATSRQRRCDRHTNGARGSRTHWLARRRRSVVCSRWSWRTSLPAVPARRCSPVLLAGETA